MNVYCGSRSSRPTSLFSLGLLDGLLDGLQDVRVGRPCVREVSSVGVALDRLVTTLMGNSG